jgi:hypothetical protein
MTGKPPKSIIRIIVNSADESRLKALCEKRGMTQISLVSRIVKWLGRQDAEVQGGILNDQPGGALESKVLKRLAARADGRPKKKG